MCGIFSLLRCETAGASPTRALLNGTHHVRHRGPDDEGYLLWSAGSPTEVFAGPDTSPGSRAEFSLRELPAVSDWRVGFGHRRLSIVDLSPAGHQPMVHRPTGLTIIYNGEIYNHIELRRELQERGHQFLSHCDTEVILAAWAEWGPECLHRFNGMFAFVLLDPRGKGRLHAVRDRFGVKPLYWSRVGEYLAFASEIKQIRSLPGFAAHLDRGTTRDYLATGLLDISRHTFDENIKQILGGERAVVNLEDANPTVQVMRWYNLEAQPFSGSLLDAADRFRELLSDSVRLRLRADVPVGSCLSGGLDSSAIVCMARQHLDTEGEHHGQVTVTSRYPAARFDEWHFAEQVIRMTEATPVEVWPTIERLQAELDAQLWHMDDPFGSTSQFSQWCVFAGAAEAGLKVMLDGQGSDEQLAGYNGNDAALYTGMLRRWSVVDLAMEIKGFRKRHGAIPIAQLIFALRNAMPVTDMLLPSRLRVSPSGPEWLRLDAPSHVETQPPRDLNDSLRRQTLTGSLPVLLRYEDRNSMARSIESRVPFLDYRLVEFLAGLPDSMKLRQGETKLVLREGLRGVVPESIRQRRDKMGFVSPEEIWLRETATGWFEEMIEAAIDVAPEFYFPDRVRRMLKDMVSGATPFNSEPWRILCLGRWMSTISAGNRIAEGVVPMSATH
ncbi:MAG: asparagine synthase (glutamine-hydrolyzing) [Gemmatimonadaceae bacterium]|nr:asparagine synthase (glutamine-hydrolyzing) [Gemmatimonadaceae bacterium]